MGTDKAFLSLGRRIFISIIAQEILDVSDDVVIVTGRKSSAQFMKEVSERRVRFVNNLLFTVNPSTVAY